MGRDLGSRDVVAAGSTVLSNAGVIVVENIEE